MSKLCFLWCVYYTCTYVHIHRMKYYLAPKSNEAPYSCHYESSPIQRIKRERRELFLNTSPSLQQLLWIVLCELSSLCEGSVSAQTHT